MSEINLESLKLEYNRKNIFLIFVIFLIFIPLISFLFNKFLTPINISCKGIHLKQNINIPTLFTIVSAIFGVFVVYVQILKDKRLNQSRFILDLNSYFINNEKINKIFTELELNEFSKKKNKNLQKINSLNVTEYITFFETIENLLERKIVSIKQVNDLFSKRFFIFFHNKEHQKNIVKYNKYLSNIYRLHSKLIRYKLKNNIEIPYKENLLNYVDKDYYKYSQDNFYFKILKVFSISTIFLTFFVIILFKFRNFYSSYFESSCKDLEIEITSLIGFFSSVVGGVAFYIQTRKDRKLNEGRFLIGLNNSFSSNECLSKLFLKLQLQDENSAIKLTSKDIVASTSYLIFFETLGTLVEKNVIKISQINDLFSKRFFILINNRVIQNKKFVKDGIYYKAIYRLYKKWISYKKIRKEQLIYNKYPFSRLKNYEQYSK